MDRLLILLGAHLDALWRRYLKASIGGDDHIQLVNLNTAAVAADSPYSVGGHPHGLDVIGWRRWLKERRIARVDCYDPTNNTLAALVGGRLLGIDNRIVLTGKCDPSALRRMGRLAPIVGRYCCWADFIAADLQRMGVKPSKIEVTAPVLPVGDLQSSQPLPSQIEVGSPVLLALDSAVHTAAVHPAIKAAAILKHMTFGLKLVVAGPCTDAQCRHLLKRQRNFDADGMLYIDRDETDWLVLCEAADVVIATGPRLVEIMRLLHARQAVVPIVAAAGDHEEFLDDYDRAHIADSAEARPFAIAICDALKL